MKIIVITGPTGVGKTKLSIRLAKEVDGEIINADSTQVYKNMDIATAKIKESEKEGIVHHLISFVDVKNDYSAFDFQKDCREKIDEILKKKKTPIIVGGTGLYLKSALYDYKFEDKENEDFSHLTNEEIYCELKKIDPDTKIHENNRRRMISSLNYFLHNKKPYSKKGKDDELLYDAVFIGLTTDRKTLYEKINNRVDLMFEEGLMSEANHFYNLGIRTKAVMTPIGYKELFDYFDNKINLEEAKELIKKRSRNYAKRQYTWFNNQLSLNWFYVNYNNFSLTEEDIINFIKKQK